MLVTRLLTNSAKHFDPDGHSDGRTELHCSVISLNRMAACFTGVTFQVEEMPDFDDVACGVISGLIGHIIRDEAVSMLITRLLTNFANHLDPSWRKSPT